MRDERPAQPSGGSKRANQIERWIDEQEALYDATTPASRRLHEQACVVMPGGDTRLGTFVHPHPIYLVRGQGARIWDEDDRELLDLSSPLTCIHGHSHPAI